VGIKPLKSVEKEMKLFMFTLSICKGCMYVAGGVNAYSGSISSVERYDPLVDEWTICCSLSQARGGHAMVTYFGRIIVIGGMNSYMQTCRDAEWYNEVFKPGKTRCIDF